MSNGPWVFVGNMLDHYHWGATDQMRYVPKRVEFDNFVQARNYLAHQTTITRFFEGNLHIENEHELVIVKYYKSQNYMITEAVETNIRQADIRRILNLSYRMDMVAKMTFFKDASKYNQSQIEVMAVLAAILSEGSLHSAGRALLGMSFSEVDGGETFDESIENETPISDERISKALKELAIRNKRPFV